MMIKVGSDFSGVGAFNQALIRLEIDFEEVYACDMDKYARQTYIHNYGEPKYYPTNVYDRKIPTDSLDIYMTSPPCQAFSLAGKRLGKDDKRGILFFNSLEFIQQNKPRYFIFENVKGLLSDDGGKTFSEWVNLLGGKSVNGNTILFPYEDAVPYHLYWEVLNAKEHGIPQNRERVFLVGIRDDVDNTFRFPIEEHLTKRLKDVLEQDVDDKYLLNDNIIDSIITNEEKNDVIIHDIPEIVKLRKYDVEISKLQQCLKNHKNKSIKAIAEELNVPKTEVEHWFRTDKYFGIPNAQIWFDLKKCINITTTEFDASITEYIEKEGVFEKSNRVYDENGIAPTMTSTSADERILVNDVKVGTWRTHEDGRGFREIEDGNCPTIPARAREDGSGQPVIKIDSGTYKGYDKAIILDCYNNTIRKDGLSGTITQHCSRSGMTNGMKVIQLNQSLESGGKQPYQQNRMYDINGINPALNAGQSTWGGNIINDYKIRRLTPRECFRLMDFPDTFTWTCSDSQAYKQAGNSIVVNVLYKILKNLNLSKSTT